MKTLRWFDENLEIFLTSVTICALVVMMALQVFMRYVLNASLSWPEELGRYLFVWVCFIGVSYSARADTHLKIDIILEYVNPKVKIVFAVIRDLSFLIFSYYMVIGGIDVYKDMSETMQLSPALGLPYKFVYLALPVGFALTGLRIIQKYLLKLKGKNFRTELKDKETTHTFEQQTL